ncbi:MAG: STAS domain-containing protein [Ilumatobacteraceae bacterium]|nr:STAS domain-containing protein [Ilumatobacteraceae bacterium]
MANGGMYVDVAHVGGQAVTTVRGEIDIASADQLGAALDKVAAEEPVVLDLSAVDFMDSSGLAVLLRQSMRRHDAGGALQIRRPSVPVRRLLLFCCLEHLLEPELEAEKPKRRWAFKRTEV